MIIICKICNSYACPSSCPNFDGRLIELGESLCECANCESRLYDDETYYEHDGKLLCAECAEELISPELLHFLGCTDIKDFFEMLY